jgi:cell division protease FtsH
VSQKKSFKFPKFKGIKNTKKPNKSSPAAARKILRGPLFWIIAALVAVSIFGQISATGEEFKKVETSVILNEISLNNVKSALVIDREQKVRVVLKDGEFVDGAAKIEASYVAGQEALIVELLTSNPPSTTWDIEVPICFINFEYFANLADYLLTPIVYGWRTRQSSFIFWQIKG